MSEQEKEDMSLSYMKTMLKKMHKLRALNAEPNLVIIRSKVWKILTHSVILNRETALDITTSFAGMEVLVSDRFTEDIIVCSTADDIK